MSDQTPDTTPGPSLSMTPPSGPPMAPPSGPPVTPYSGGSAGWSRPDDAHYSDDPSLLDTSFDTSKSTLAHYDEQDYDDVPSEKTSRFRRTEKVRKEPRAPREKKAAKDSAPLDDIVVVVPVLTSFDLLEGGYQKVIRARIGIMAMAGVFGLIAVLLTTLGLAANSHTASLKSQTSALVASERSYTTRLGALTNYTSPTGRTYQGSVLQGDLNFRAPLVRLAASGATNVAKVLSDVAALTGSQVAISAIQINPTSSTTAVTTTTITSSPATSSSIPGIPTSTGLPLTISVTATSNAALDGFLTRLGTLKYLTGTTLSSLSGTPPLVVGTLTATVQGLSYPVPSAARLPVTSGGSHG